MEKKEADPKADPQKHQIFSSISGDGKPNSPPQSAKRVYRWADLPNSKEMATFIVKDPDKEPREISVANNQRRVLEGLMQSPIYAASYCRLSDQVLPLRRDKGISIRCDMYRNDPETGRERYGVYVLESEVTRIDDQQVAA